VRIATQGHRLCGRGEADVFALTNKIPGGFARRLLADPLVAMMAVHD
jgi:hypothetical protein